MTNPFRSTSDSGRPFDAQGDQSLSVDSRLCGHTRDPVGRIVLAAGNTDLRTRDDRTHNVSTDRRTSETIGAGRLISRHLTLAELQLIDKRGIWLTADHISLPGRPGL